MEDEVLEIVFDGDRLVETRVEQLPKHIARCSICRKRILKRRLSVHQQMPECYVIRQMAEMQAAGWVRAPGPIFTMAKTCGFEVKEGPIGAFNDSRPALHKQQNTDRVRWEHLPDVRSVVAHGWWVRIDVALAIDMVKASRCRSRAQRISLLKRLVAVGRGCPLWNAVDAYLRLCNHKIPKDW